MKTIIKPWGKEEWLELNDSYCYKRIYINKGYKTSLQYHNFKRETNYIIEGEAEVWLENHEGVIEKKLMRSGEYFNVTPPKKHRVIALTDLIMQEVSTPEVDDVIRVEDDTNRPDGKIEGEHKTPAVLILCAGLGTRLKDLTKHINKVLLPINNVAILTHIINKFSSDYEFIITLGYKGDSIKEYCQIAHPNLKFKFIDVNQFEGEGTGPGYSALMCHDYLQRPFYFITGDCVIDSPLPHLDGNWLGVYPTSYPEKYSTINVDDNNNIISLVNKSENGNDLAFIGLGCIFDYDIFWSELKNNLKNGELVYAFEDVKKYPSLKVKKLKWFDTGNLDDLSKTKDYFDDKPLSLQKNTGEITYNINGRFLKFIPNQTVLKDRVSRADKLKNLIPNNFGNTENFIYYDWMEGKSLYEHNNFNYYVKFLDEFKKTLKYSTEISTEEISKFYIEKTKKRIELFLERNSEKYYTQRHFINDVSRPSLSEITDKIDYGAFKDNPSYSNFHGDLQFDNIIYNTNNNEFYYIDWRDSFGDSTDTGDVYYDLSKLYGGLMIPYNIMKDENSITISEGMYSVSYDYKIPKDLSKFKIYYEKWLQENGFDLQKIKLITGLIYLNMSPLHDGNFGKMLWFKSIEILDTYDK